jgi:hypothetical protein
MKRYLPWIIGATVVLTPALAWAGVKGAQAAGWLDCGCSCF